jgi:hypothetical protein
MSEGGINLEEGKIYEESEMITLAKQLAPIYVRYMNGKESIRMAQKETEQRGVNQRIRSCPRWGAAMHIGFSAEHPERQGSIEFIRAANGYFRLEQDNSTEK